VKFDLANIGAGSVLSARLVNPANGEKSAWQTIEDRSQFFAIPLGWEDAFVHIRAVAR
jgi:hypothetical protein